MSVSLVDDAEKYLVDPKNTVDDRVKYLLRLSGLSGLTFSNKAWLGQVFLGTLTPGERKAFKDKVEQLERSIASWQLRSTNNN